MRRETHTDLKDGDEDIVSHDVRIKLLYVQLVCQPHKKSLRHIYIVHTCSRTMKAFGRSKEGGDLGIVKVWLSPWQNHFQGLVAYGSSIKGYDWPLHNQKLKPVVWKYIELDAEWELLPLLNKKSTYYAFISGLGHTAFGLGVCTRPSSWELTPFFGTNI